MASTKRKRRRHHTRRVAVTGRRTSHRRRRYRRNPGFGGLHFPSTNRLIGGLAGAVGGTMIGNLLFKSATGPMRTAATIAGGIAVSMAARMVLGGDAAEAALLVGIAVPVAGMVAAHLPGSPTAGYNLSSDALQQLGAYPDGFTETVAGLPDASEFAFASDDE